VAVVTEGIDRIEPTGIRTRDGVLHEVDVIVYATGFHANRYLWPMDIVGRDGAVLAEQWGERPTALWGIAAPNFPNLFCMYGPGTNLASGGSLIFHSECQIRYIVQVLAWLVSGRARAVEVTANAHDAYVHRFREQMATMIWEHPSIKSSWYQNVDGEVYILSPWRLVDYWTWTRSPEVGDYALR
jgi:4-hydroxyacetophenone monooxygenase